MVEWFGTEEMKKEMRSDITTKRGAPPSIVEWIILTWVAGNYQSMIQSVRLLVHLTLDSYAASSCEFTLIHLHSFVRRSHME